jgi:ABC-type nitrate/sulfonate/bicarbonate transport system substrate-binding protein
VRLGIPERDNIQYLALWVALGAGYLEQEGLEVQLVFPPASNQIQSVLMRGEADIALLQPPMYLGLIAQHSPIVLFANLLATNHHAACEYCWPRRGWTPIATSR